MSGTRSCGARPDRGPVRSSFEQENWDRAFKLYQTILVQHRDSQSDDDTVLVYYRLGTVKRRQNEPRKALNYMEKALEVQPFNRQVLESVIELQSASNDWEGVIQAKRALAEVAMESDAQAEIYKEIGKLYLEKLKNWRKSASAYEMSISAGVSRASDSASVTIQPSPRA